MPGWADPAAMLESVDSTGSTSRWTRAGTTGTRSSGATRTAPAREPGSPGTGPTGRWTTRALRKLYALVVMLSHDLTPEKASAEVEHHAAFQFIEVACSDIPRYDLIQRLLPLTG